MSRFFKREEKRPFNYPTIEEYKESSRSRMWIGGIILTGLVLFILYSIFK